jgi:hypothetical protein
LAFDARWEQGFKGQYSMVMTRACLILLVTFDLQGALLGETHDPSHFSAVITGVVEYADGRAVYGAQILADSDSGGFGRLPAAITNEHGRFALRVWSPGFYTLRASKVAGAYPDASWATCTERPPAAQIRVSEPGRVDVGVVRLGPQGVQLLGVVTDAETGKPVEDAQVIVQCADDPSSQLETNLNLQPRTGGFLLVLPAARVRVIVRAAGYEDWTYTGDDCDGAAKPLAIKPAKTVELTVRMRALPAE